MARSILQQVNGFTPVIDIVAQDVGFVTAAVYGVHWRFSQMQDGVSRASMETIASRLDISTKTARRHTQKLCEHGYLQDLTPNRRNAPHVYQDTGQVVIESLMQARLVRESNQNAPRLDRESNLVGQKVQPGWSESPTWLDRESNEDSIKIQEEEERMKKILSSLWQAITSSLQGIMDAATYEAHFARATPVAIHKSNLIVALPNPRSVGAIAHLNGRITDAIRKQHGLTLTFIAEPE